MAQQLLLLLSQPLFPSLPLSLPLPMPLALPLPLPLSVGMLTMIMKPASGRAARVAKQQVGPHSALSAPPLVLLPLRTHTQIQSATACSCFGPLRLLWSPFVLVSVSVSLTFFRFCAAATRRGNFLSYAHLRSLRPFPALSLSLSHSLAATLVCCLVLAASVSKLCLEISLLQISLACDTRRVVVGSASLHSFGARSARCSLLDNFATTPTMPLPNGQTLCNRRRRRWLWHRV